MSATLQDMAIPYTVKELRVWYDPRTWRLFRGGTLVARTTDEIAHHPELVARLNVLCEDAHVLRVDVAMGKVDIPLYQRRVAEIRQNIGNIIYK